MDDHDDSAAKLNAALKLAKHAPESHPLFFALIARSSSNSVLLISKVKLSPKEITEAKGSGGGKTLKGRCFGQEGKLIFTMPSEPAQGLNNLIQMCAKRVGVVIVAEARAASGMEDEVEEKEGTEAELTPESPPAPPPAPPPPPTPSGARAPEAKRGGEPARSEIPSALAQQIKGLKDRLMVLIQKANNLNHTEAKQACKDAILKLSEAEVFGHKGDIDQANQLVAVAKARCEEAIRALTAAPSTSPKPSVAPTAPQQEPEAPVGADPAVQLQQRINEVKSLVEGLKDANPTVYGSLLKRLTAVQNGDPAPNDNGQQKTLNEIEAEAYAALENGVPDPNSGLAPDKLMPIWLKAKESVDSQIAKLQAALRQTKDDDFIRVADQGLPGLTKGLYANLMAALMDCDQNPEAKTKSKALGLVGQYQQFLKADAGVRLCDANPFGVGVNLRGTLLPALALLAVNLKR